MKVKLTSKTPLQKAMREPEANSLRHALISRRWQCLWVDPLAWHIGHLEVLQCPPPCPVIPSAISSPTESSVPFHADLKAIHATLAHIVRLENRALMLREIVKCLIKHKRGEYNIAGWKVKKEGKLVLHYGTERVVVLTLNMIGRENGNFPIFAYIDHEWLRGKKRFGRYLANVQRNLSSEYPQPEIDPFFVATMIAMAQTQYHSAAREETGGADVETFQVHLLCPNQDISSLYRYSANISKKYLMKFDNPYKSSNVQLEITQLETPVESLGKMGQLLEDILLRNVPIQYHPPSTEARLETLSATPGPETPETRETMEDRLKRNRSICSESGPNIQDELVPKRQKKDNDDDTPMYGTN